MSKAAKAASARFHASHDSTPRDAIAFLKSDHREVEDLFDEYEHANTANKATLALQICAALTVHMQIEEEIFYPAFIAMAGDAPLHHEAVIEHDGARKLIEEIEAAPPGDEYFDAKVKVLSEMIKHHVREEERPRGMFAEARDSDMDLKSLAVEMFARKNELQTSQEKRHPPHAFI